MLQKQQDIQDKVGKSLNNQEVKDLVGTRTKKETKEILESGRKRAQIAAATVNLRIGNNKYINIELNLIYLLTMFVITILF